MAEFEYKLIRSKRKGVRLNIRDGQIFIYAPMNMSVEAIDGIINEKRSWLIKHIENQKRKLSGFENVLSLQCVMLWGQIYEVRSSADIKRMKFSDGILFVPQDEKKKKTAIKRWYIQIAQQRLLLMLENISGKCGIAYSDFALSNARTSWGSCTKDKIIRLNWRLVMLSEKYAEYVAIHELCHTFHLNHSKDFWIKVERYCPQYKRIKKEMAEFSILCNYL